MEPTSLKFSIILDDKDFKRRVEEDIALAKRLNDSLSKSFNTSSITKATNEVANASKKATAAANENAAAQKEVTAAAEESARKLSTGGGSLTRAWLRFTGVVWSVVSAIRLFTRTLGAAIKNIAKFQQANANLATIMQVSRKEIEVLTNDALMLGRTTEWTASQVTELQTALAKLGYNIPQIRNMQASVLQFATAVGAELPEAANLAGASLRMFGMRSSETQKALEILTAATNKSALDFDKLKVSLPYVGAIAHSIGFDIAQTASLLGVLTNAGLESSRSGTGLRQVLLELSKTNGKLQTAMGGNIKTFDDFVNGLQAMRDRGLQAGEATKLVSTRASSALLILANGVDTIRKLNDEVRDTDGLLKTIQADRLNTLHGSTLLLKSAWEGLIQTFRDSAGPMKAIVDWLTKIVRATSLAAGRANRVAQGTKEYIGSDELSKTYQDMYDRLREQGHSEEEATRLVREQLVNKLNGYRKALEEDIDNSIEGKWWYKAAQYSPFLQMPPLVRKMAHNAASKKYRRDSEAIDAVEAAWDSVSAYIESRSKEDAEIAAQNFLEQWRTIFDAQGAKAVREAMSKVSGYDDIKRQVEEYIASGGSGGALDRGKGSESAAEKEQRELINGLKDEANYLRKILESYEKLKPYLGEEGAAAKMAEIFGEGEYSTAAIEQGILGITDALRKMGKEGAEAAEDIEQSLGLDEFSRVYKQLTADQQAAEAAKKALDKYQKTLRKWMGEDFNIGGTGFEYDINKVFSDFNTKVGSVQEKYIEAVKEAEEAHKGDADAIARETANLQALRDAEIQYERVRSQERLNNLAESYLKDQYFYRGLNFDNLSKMSFRQISKMKRELKEISDEALNLGGDIAYAESFLASLGMSIDTLTEEQLESLRDKLPEATIEFIKAAKAAKDTGLSFDKLSELIQSAIKKKLSDLSEEELKALAKLAKYAANQVLALANSFSELAEATGNTRVMQAAESINAIGQFASDVAQGFTQGGVYGAIIGAVASIGKTIMNDLKEEEIAAKEAKEAAIAISNLEDKRAAERQSGIFGTNDIGKLREYVKVLQKYGKAVSEIESGMKFRAEGGNSLAADFMRDFGDGNGNLDIFKLKEAVESGLLSFTDEEVNNAIKQYAEALKEVDGLVESVFGDIAASAADTIVDSWVEAGNAALDYADILDDVARAYSKMLIQSVIMETALDPITDDLKAAFMQGRYGDAMEMVAGAMQAIQDATPMYEQILNTFDPYFNRTGSSGSGGLSSGIKSITEDTANLLASYINAIRADVSFIRMMQEKGWSHIEAFGMSLPTLSDHIAQIAATNFDIAQSNQSILSELRSVIGAPGTSGMVVRVEQY